AIRVNWCRPMREGENDMWVWRQGHMGRLGKGLGTVQVRWGCTGMAGEGVVVLAGKGVGDMGYEHPNTTLETESDEIIKSGVEELVQILSENEVTSEDKRECDMLVCENSPICDDHFEIFFYSNNDDDISSDDDVFEDIEYVEASLPDPEIICLAEENDVEEEEKFCVWIGFRGCLDSGLSTKKLSRKAASELLHGILNLPGSQ
nr:hypothetical protein [Tanacetum cinerariifolium]